LFKIEKYLLEPPPALCHPPGQEAIARISQAQKFKNTVTDRAYNYETGIESQDIQKSSDTLPR
jgi:hypothetical protein